MPSRKDRLSVRAGRVEKKLTYDLRKWVSESETGPRLNPDFWKRRTFWKRHVWPFQWRTPSGALEVISVSPGSEASVALGCSCSPIVNKGGQGEAMPHTRERLFHINPGCHLHAVARRHKNNGRRARLPKNEKQRKATTKYLADTYYSQEGGKG